MKKLVSISLVASLAILAGIFYDSSANAQTAGNDQSQSVRCNVAQARLNTRITQVEKIKTVQTTIYTNLLAKVETTLTSAETTDFDVTDLVAARDTLTTAIETYTTKSTDYATLLMATKNLSCGESGGAFTTSLVSSRGALVEARQATLTVRTAFRKEVIPALQAYAAWLKENTTVEGTN